MVEYSTGGLDLVFSAVSDPTRRAILQALSEKPATISEIARPFSVSLNAVSKHVMVLERAGLVRREVHGREHRCRLQAHPLEDASAWLENYRQFWEVRLDALERYVAKRMKSAKSKRVRKGTISHGRSQ